MASKRKWPFFQTVREVGVKISAVSEGISWGAPALKAHGKGIAIITRHSSAEPDTIAVRVSFTDRDWLIASRPEVYYVKPHYLPYPCVLVRVKKIKRKELRELLEVAVEFAERKRRVPKPARN